MKTDLLYAICSMPHLLVTLEQLPLKAIYIYTYIYNIYINVAERRNHVCISLLGMIKESATKTDWKISR